MSKNVNRKVTLSRGPITMIRFYEDPGRLCTVDLVRLETACRLERGDERTHAAWSSTLTLVE